MDRSGAGCVHVCVRSGRHHVCLIITPQSSLASSLSDRLSVRPFVCPPVRLALLSRTKRTVTRRECAAQLARATITYGLALAASCAHLSVAHNLSLSCGGQLEAHVSHFAPGAPRSEVFFLCVCVCEGGRERKQFSSPNSSRPSCLCDVGLICVSGHISTSPLCRRQVWAYCYFSVSDFFFPSLLSFFPFSTVTVLQVERKLIKKCLCLLYLRRAASLFSTRAWK